MRREILPDRRRRPRKEAKRFMAAWMLMVGMVTIINVTMVGAMVQLAGNIPDRSLLAIFSRYLKKRGEPEGSLLHPLEAAYRLGRLRRGSLWSAAAAAAAAAGFTFWALAAGWGAVALTALTLWVAAANLAFLSLPLDSWRRRARRMDWEVMEEGSPPGGMVPGGPGSPPG